MVERKVAEKVTKMGHSILESCSFLPAARDVHRSVLDQLHGPCLDPRPDAHP